MWSLASVFNGVLYYLGNPIFSSAMSFLSYSGEGSSSHGHGGYMVQSTHPVSAEDTEVRSGLPPAHSCPFSVDKGLDWLPEFKFIWNSMLLLLILCKTKYKRGKRPTKPP